MSKDEKGNSRENDQENRLNEVLLSFLEALEKGEAPSKGEILSRYPQFAEELKEFFAKHEQLQNLIGASPTESDSSLASTAFLPIRFGRYRIIEKIASRAGSHVYRAFDTQWLLRLPPDQKTAVFFRFFKNMRIREISEEMNRTPQSVAGLLRRGLKNLGDHIENQDRK